MATPTLEQLNSTVLLLRGEFNALKKSHDALDDKLELVYASKSSVLTLDAKVDTLLEALTDRVSELEERYATIVSPTATRYYLSLEDMTELRGIIRTFSALRTEIENSLANMVAVTTRTA